MKFVFGRNPQASFKIFDDEGNDLTSKLLVKSFKYEVDAHNPQPKITLELCSASVEVDADFKDMVVTREVILPRE